MNKKVVYLALISVLFLGIGINVSHQLFIWGFQTVTGGDELAHFSRAQAIARGYVDAYHEYDNPQYYDFYPGGFHVLAAQFIVLSGFTPHYNISFVFKVVYALLTGIFAFLIGSRINWKIGIFSSFFFATYFRVFTWSKPFYINITSPQNTFGSVFISTPMIFFTILLYLMFLKAKDGELKYGSLVAFSGVVHGISHISTYIGFLVNFVGFSVIILIFILLKYRSYFLKIVKMILYTVFSLPFVFFIYYFPMFPDVLFSPYLPDKFFPPFIPSALLPHLPVISMIGLAFVVIILYILNTRSENINITYIKIDKRIFMLMVAGYILLYSSVLYLVSKDPFAYPRSGSVILIGIFPTYIPQFYPGIVPTVSLLIGFSMFFLTLLSFIWAYHSRFVNFNFMLIIYISFYLIWFVFAIVIKYYPNRIIYFQYVLPFIYATGLVSIFIKSRTDESSKRFRVIRNIARNGNIKKTIAVGIVLMVLSTSVISQLTKDPELRYVSAHPPVDIGKHSPTRSDPSLSCTVTYLTEPGEFILSTPENLEVMATTSDIRSPCNHWSQTYTDHRDWGALVKALRGTDSRPFYDTYDARYFVVGYGDIYGATSIFGYGKYHSPDIYSRNPNYILIYQDQYNERIYMYY